MNIYTITWHHLLWKPSHAKILPGVFLGSFEFLSLGILRLITISSLCVFLGLSCVHPSLFFLVGQYVFPRIFSFFRAILLTVAQRHVIWTSIFGFPSSAPPTIWRTCAKTLLACTFRFSISISKLSCSKYSLIGILFEKPTGNLFFVSLAIDCFSTPTLMYVFPLLASYFVYYENFERG